MSSNDELNNLYVFTCILMIKDGEMKEHGSRYWGSKAQTNTSLCLPDASRPYSGTSAASAYLRHLLNSYIVFRIYYNIQYETIAFLIKILTLIQWTVFSSYSFSQSMKTNGLESINELLPGTCIVWFQPEWYHSKFAVLHLAAVINSNLFHIWCPSGPLMTSNPPRLLKHWVYSLWWKCHL